MALPLLKEITDLWLKQIDFAEKAKERDFGLAAAQAWKYLGREYVPVYWEGEHEFPSGEEGEVKPVIVGKSAEFVALMLPYIHARVPHRLVSPSRPPMPGNIPVPPQMDEEAARSLVEQLAAQRAQLDSQDSFRAWLMQWWLNYITHEGYDLANEARTALPEALVKGVGLLWTELTDGPYGVMPASFYDSVDNLFIDPDAERLQDAAWIVRARQMSNWKIAERFGRDVRQIRGEMETSRRQAVRRVNPNTHKDTEGDVGTYYEVWSRMGVGHRLVGASQTMKREAEALDNLGAYVFLAVMPGVDEPLNLPSEAIAGAEVQSEWLPRIGWPIAFHAEPTDPWPCTPCAFYANAHDPWAQSPLASGQQCQVYLDQLYHYLMRRARTSCRDIIFTSSGLSLKNQDAIEKGADFEVVEYDGDPGLEIDNLVKILEFPSLNSDIWNVANMVERQFERATGMTPLLGGAQPDTQERSALASRVREAHTTSRPDDYADVVEAWMSRIAAKEARATRLFVPAPYELFGEPAPNDAGEWTPQSFLSAMWDQLVRTDDPRVAASELSYTVEAGSGRRKNKQKQAADATQLSQSLGQYFFGYGQLTGNFNAFNGLVKMIAEALDVPVGGMYLPSIPPPQAEETE